MSGVLMVSVGNSYGYKPVNTVAPAVTGAAQVGQTISCSTGTWDAAPASISYTYQWQRNGSNVGGATSNTYAIDFADFGTTLRCVVTATNAVGATSANSNSTASVADMAAGTAYAGGYYAGKISVNANGVATHRLVIAPKASGETNSIALRTDASVTTGTDSRIDGPANSAAMNNSNHPAAQFCEGLSINGYTDWYLPAMDEWATIYYFLKPTTQDNATSYGATDYAVSPQPINTNYDLTSPAQTSSALFQSGGSEAITTSPAAIWTSTQNTANTNQGIGIAVTNGSFQFLGKTFLRGARAVRRVTI